MSKFVAGFVMGALVLGALTVVGAGLYVNQTRPASEQVSAEPAGPPPSNPNGSGESAYIVEPSCVYTSYDNYVLYYNAQYANYVCGHPASFDPAAGPMPDSCARSELMERVYCRGEDLPLTTEVVDGYLGGW